MKFRIKECCINLIFRKDSTVGFKAVILLVCALVMMVGDHHGHSFHKWRSRLAFIVMPLEYVVTWPINLVNSTVTYFTLHENLAKENIRLRAQVMLLNSELQKQYAVESDNKVLRALLRSSTKIPGEVATAQILSLSSNPFNLEVVLNKGKADNVFVGQPVLDINGVMGQVVEAGMFTSRVLLITSIKSVIPVQINRTGLRSIAVGEGNASTLRLQHITHTTDIQVGDVVVTSGLGDRFPFGYPVGEVASIKRDPGGDFLNIILAPRARLNSSRLVLLLWPQKVKKDIQVEKKSKSKQGERKKSVTIKEGNKQ